MYYYERSSIYYAAAQRKRVIKNDFDCRCGRIRYGPFLNPVSVHGMGEGRRGLSKVSFSKIDNIDGRAINFFFVNMNNYDKNFRYVCIFWEISKKKILKWKVYPLRIDPWC